VKAIGDERAQSHAAKNTTARLHPKYQPIANVWLLVQYFTSSLVLPDFLPPNRPSSRKIHQNPGEAKRRGWRKEKRRSVATNHRIVAHQRRAQARRGRIDSSTAANIPARLSRAAGGGAGPNGRREGEPGVNLVQEGRAHRELTNVKYRRFLRSEPFHWAQLGFTAAKHWSHGLPTERNLVGRGGLPAMTKPASATNKPDIGKHTHRRQIINRTQAPPGARAENSPHIVPGATPPGSLPSRARQESQRLSISSAPGEIQTAAKTTAGNDA